MTERVWPHQVVGDVLVLCWLLLDEIRLPLASIQELRIELVASAKGRNGLPRDSERALLAVDGRTDASMALTEPTVGLRYCTATRQFRMVPVAVDDPEHLQRVLSRTRSVSYTDYGIRTSGTFSWMITLVKLTFREDKLFHHLEIPRCALIHLNPMSLVAVTYL